MTPKEKAKDLWRKYAECNIIIEGKHSNYKGLLTKDAKQCALIAVDELIEHTDWTEVNYWQEVKQEIEKL